MAAVINAKTRLCKIASSGQVPELGGIMAPIKKCKLTDDEIVSILKSGFTVFEYNPKNQTELKELTLANNGQSPFTEEPKKNPEPSGGQDDGRKEPDLSGVLVPNENKKPEGNPNEGNAGNDGEDGDTEGGTDVDPETPAEKSGEDDKKEDDAESETPATDNENTEGQTGDTDDTPAVEGDKEEKKEEEKAPEVEPEKAATPIVLDTVPATQAAGAKKSGGRKNKK